MDPACAEPGTNVDVFDLPSIRAKLVGRWILCQGDPLFNESYDGLEFAADDKWYFLDDVNGVLERRGGFKGGGTWSLDLLDDDGTAFSVQLSMDLFGGGGNGGFVRFAEEPLKLWLSFYPFADSEYVSVTP